jgi:hypothetical protein
MEMSRSRRKSAVIGMTTAPSDKPFKVDKHRAERHAVRAAVQPLLQRLFVQVRRQWPADAGLAAPTEALLHRRSGAPHRDRNLPIAQADLELEP